MKTKHAKTLAKVFSDPVSANIKWRDVEALLISLGASIEERSGSRIMISLNGIKFGVHRPHPSPNAKRYVVRNLREFLREAEIDPGK